MNRITDIRGDIKGQMSYYCKFESYQTEKLYAIDIQYITLTCK